MGEGEKTPEHLDENPDRRSPVLVRHSFSEGGSLSPSCHAIGEGATAEAGSPVLYPSFSLLSPGPRIVGSALENLDNTGNSISRARA